MEGPPPNEEREFEAFYEAIRHRVNEAKRRREAGEAYNPHYVDISPRELTAEDMALMRKVESGTITREDLHEHDLTFYDVDPSGNFKKPRGDIPESRRLFLQEMANRADSIIRERERRTQEG